MATSMPTPAVRRLEPPPQHEASLTHKVVTTAMVMGPLAGIAVLAKKGWPSKPTKTDLAVIVVMHNIAAGGVTVGFHRLFTHKSFQTNRLIQDLLAIAGELSLEGSLFAWVTNHGEHHAFADKPGDPHSPHVDFDDDGIIGMLQGLKHAHYDWFIRKAQLKNGKAIQQLKKDNPDLETIDKLFPVFAIANFAVPFIVSLMRTKSLKKALAATFWQGAVRMTITHHITWSVNSLCHMFGTRFFETDDESTNIVLLMPLSWGETGHNWHHGDPISAWHSYGRLARKLDLAGQFIQWLKRHGWATHVKDDRDPEKVHVKLAQQAAERELEAQEAVA